MSPPGLPATIELSWDEPREVGEVVLAFDTDLDTDLDTGTDARPGLHRAQECVRDYRVEVEVEGPTDPGFEVVASEKGNFLRHRRLTFRPRSITRLRVVVEATNGDLSARFYEIRALSA